MGITLEPIGTIGLRKNTIKNHYKILKIYKKIYILLSNMDLSIVLYIYIYIYIYITIFIYNNIYIYI